MASSKIKGITIEKGGNTIKLGKAPKVQIKYVYNCKIINGRKKTSTQGRILKTLKKGTKVNVYSTSGS